MAQACNDHNPLVLFFRSVGSSSPMSLGLSASPWIPTSSATLATWPGCASHITFPLTTHTEMRTNVPDQLLCTLVCTLVTTVNCCLSNVPLLGQLYFFLKIARGEKACFLLLRLEVIIHFKCKSQYWYKLYHPLVAGKCSNWILLNRIFLHKFSEFKIIVACLFHC